MKETSNRKTLASAGSMSFDFLSLDETLIALTTLAVRGWFDVELLMSRKYEVNRIEDKGLPDNQSFHLELVVVFKAPRVIMHQE